MRILVYDVAASNRGALSILTDFYQQVRQYGKDAEWYFVVSTPKLEETSNVHVLRFPWIKRNLINRVFFDSFLIQSLVMRLKVDRVLSLQNVCITRCSLPQDISLHNALPFHKCDNTVLSGTVSIFKQKYLNKKVLASLRNANRIFVPNEWIYNSCASIDGVDKEKLVLVKPNMRFPAFADSANTGLDNLEIVFYYPANAEPYKRHDLIYKACKRLVTEGQDSFRIVLTAQGNENSYIKSIKEKCDNDKLPISFSGNMTREEVYHYYCSSVLIFPSEIETDALPIIEAMMCNSFIVATRTDFAECILKDYPNSVLVPIGDDKSLAEAMRCVLEGQYAIKEYDRRNLTAIGSEDGLVKAVLNR